MTDLSGKVFVITGGNGGIGPGMAEGIAAVVGFVPLSIHPGIQGQHRLSAGPLALGTAIRGGR